MARHEVLVGLDTPTRRYEAGDVADDLPGQSVTWLLEQGLVRVLPDAAVPDPGFAHVTEEV